MVSNARSVLKKKSKLNNIFDKIYVIHCVENEERMKNIEFQIKENNLNLEIFWSCYHPHSYVCANSLILSNRGRRINNGSEFNLTRNFYTIIKTSYLRGFKNILIFEDDFSLMKSEMLNEFVDQIPEDFDIIQFSLLFNEAMYDYKNLQKEYENDKYFIKAPFGAWSNNGLALSRKGMKYFIDKIDKEFLAADYPAFESSNNYYLLGKTTNSNLNHYISTVPIVYINQYFKSSVQTENKDDIYYMYKYIDKKYYNIYEGL